jgi:hypothetical protein
MTRDEFKQVVLLLEAHWHHDSPAEEVYALYWHELAQFEYRHVVAAIEALGRGGKTRMPLVGEIRRKLIELDLDPPSWAEAIRHFEHVKNGMDGWEPPQRCIDGTPGCDGSGWILKPEEYEITGKRRPCECVADQPKVERARRFNLFQQGRPEKCPAGKCDGSGLVPDVHTRVREVARKCTCFPKLRASRYVEMHPVLRRYIDLVSWSQVNALLVGGDTTYEAQMRAKYETLVKEMVEQRSLADLHAPGLARVERANEDDRRPLPERLAPEVAKALEAAKG